MGKGLNLKAIFSADTKDVKKGRKKHGKLFQILKVRLPGCLMNSHRCLACQWDGSGRK